MHLHSAACTHCWMEHKLISFPSPKELQALSNHYRRLRTIFLEHMELHCCSLPSHPRREWDDNQLTWKDLKTNTHSQLPLWEGSQDRVFLVDFVFFEIYWEITNGDEPVEWRSATMNGSGFDTYWDISQFEKSKWALFLNWYKSKTWIVLPSFPPPTGIHLMALGDKISDFTKFLQGGERAMSESWPEWWNH